jgi:hypothetical protein
MRALAQITHTRLKGIAIWVKKLLNLKTNTFQRLGHAAGIIQGVSEERRMLVVRDAYHEGDPLFAGQRCAHVQNDQQATQNGARERHSRPAPMPMPLMTIMHRICPRHKARSQ